MGFARWKVFWRLIAQQHEDTYYWTACFKMVKVIHFMLCVFYHDLKKSLQTHNKIDHSWITKLNLWDSERKTLPASLSSSHSLSVSLFNLSHTQTLQTNIKSYQKIQIFKLYKINSKYIWSVGVSINTKLSSAKNLSKVKLHCPSKCSFIIGMQMLISRKKVPNGSEILPKNIQVERMLFL